MNIEEIPNDSILRQYFQFPASYKLPFNWMYSKLTRRTWATLDTWNSFCARFLWIIHHFERIPLENVKVTITLCRKFVHHDWSSQNKSHITSFFSVFFWKYELQGSYWKQQCSLFSIILEGSCKESLEMGHCLWKKFMLAIRARCEIETTFHIFEKYCIWHFLIPLFWQILHFAQGIQSFFQLLHSKA